MEKTIRIHVYAGFLKINAFDRLYYFFQNKGEDWEISLYVNWLAGDKISAFEENALWTTPELNGELLVSSL